MSVQVLVATMRQSDWRKLAEMNIKSDVIFANQTDNTSYKCDSINGIKAEMISTKTKGVGINRNLAIMYSQGEILLFADDDMKYVDDYVEIVEKAFAEIPDADAIIFNIETVGQDVHRRISTAIKRIHFFNAFNYGAARIAIRRNCLVSEGVFFNTNFGGGTLYSSGEDTLFIRDLLKNKLKIYTYPKFIGTVDQTSSTWFNGYSSKYFYDKGALFYSLSHRFYKPLLLIDLFRHWDIYKVSKMRKWSIYKIEKAGVRGVKGLVPYDEMTF